MTTYRETLLSPTSVTAAHEMAHALLFEHFFPGSVEYVITDPTHIDNDGVKGTYVKLAPGDYDKHNLVVGMMAGWAAEEMLGEPHAEMHSSDDINYILNKLPDGMPSDVKWKCIREGVKEATNLLSEPSNAEKHEQLIALFLKRRLDRIAGEEVRAELHSPPTKEPPQD
jgi:hypothetical protein